MKLICDARKFQELANMITAFGKLIEAAEEYDIEPWEANRIITSIASRFSDVKISLKSVMDDARLKD